MDPCEPNPCGPHAYCTPTGDKNSALCTCQLGYFGDPCRPECERHTDCAPDLMCKNLKCADPCPGFCGVGATCEVKNHRVKCRCR